jgi:hypothetical protein
MINKPLSLQPTLSLLIHASLVWLLHNRLRHGGASLPFGDGALGRPVTLPQPPGDCACRAGRALIADSVTLSNASSLVAASPYSQGTGSRSCRLDPDFPPRCSLMTTGRRAGYRPPRPGDFYKSYCRNRSQRRWNDGHPEFISIWKTVAVHPPTWNPGILAQRQTRRGTGSVLPYAVARCRRPCKTCPPVEAARFAALQY